MHPDVVYVPSGWNGYKYWMCCTTYASDNQEDPCILVSNDRVTWAPPVGLTNPMSTGRNKDNDMVLVGGTMYLFWQQQSGANDTLLRTSTDGVNWTPAQLVLRTTSMRDVRLSPAIVYDSGTSTWWMYSVGMDSTETFLELNYRTATNPAGPWGALTPLGYTVPTYGTTGVHYPWHIDAFDFNGLHYLLINESAQTGRNLRFAVSNDRINFTPAASPFMVTIAGNWDGGSLYRSTCVPRTDSNLLFLWYSANDGSNWRVGYTEIPVAGNLPTL